MSLQNLKDGLFLNPIVSFNPELIFEWMTILLKHDQRRIQNATRYQGAFKKENVVEFVFRICDKLNQPSVVRFLAVELLDRFLVQHVLDLYAYVQNLTSPIEAKREEWKLIQSRVKTQLMLRAASCCQIASKLCLNYTALGIRKVWSLLRGLGHKYSADGILQSEMRILKTLNYDVMLPTPLVYVEVLLAILTESRCLVKVDDYYTTCTDLLDVVLIRYCAIYRSLCDILIDRRTPSQSRRTAEGIKSDYLLLAASIVTSASYLINLADTNKVLDRLSELTLVSADDVLDFATVIMRELCIEK